MSSGSTYPATLDLWTNKIDGDYLTVADINQFRSAVELLEAGPILPNVGSISAPAYSFQGDSNTGIWRSGADTIDFAVGAVRALQLITTASGVNYHLFAPSATGNAAVHQVAGSDTNIGLQLVTKGTGPHIFSRASGSTEDARISSGIVLVGTTLGTGSVAGDIVSKNTGAHRFVNFAGTSAANYGIISDVSDNLQLHVPGASDSINFHFANALYGWLQMQNSGLGLLFSESSADHAAPSANQFVMFGKDNGSGKTQVAVRFNTGAVQILTTEP